MPGEELVVGDIVRVKYGEIVPADIRIIEDCKGFKVQYDQQHGRQLLNLILI